MAKGKNRQTKSKNTTPIKKSNKKEEAQPFVKSKRKYVMLPLPVKIKIGRKICERVKEGKWNISSICDSFDIPYKTFQQWVFDWESRGYDKPKPGYIREIAELYKKSTEDGIVERKDRLREGLWMGIERRINGEVVEDVSHSVAERAVTVKETHKKADGSETTKQDFKVIELRTVTKTTKTILPSDVMLIYASKNLLPDHFSDTVINQNEHKVEVNPYANLTDEELDEKARELDSAIQEAEVVEEDQKQLGDGEEDNSKNDD